MTTLTMKEEKRLEVIQRVFRGELTVVEAAMVVGVSERQCYRIKARVTKRGAKGVIHGNPGRPCKRKTKEKDDRVPPSLLLSRRTLKVVRESLALGHA